jgi:hypothetical protein
MPNPLKLTSEDVNNPKIVAILQRTADQEALHHSDAIVLEESESGFRLICAIPCFAELGRTYLVKRQGFEHLSEVSLSEVTNVTLNGKPFGHYYLGSYVS